MIWSAALMLRLGYKRGIRFEYLGDRSVFRRIKPRACIYSILYYKGNMI